MNLRLGVGLNRHGDMRDKGKKHRRLQEQEGTNTGTGRTNLTRQGTQTATETERPYINWDILERLEVNKYGDTDDRTQR